MRSFIWSLKELSKGASERILQNCVDTDLLLDDAADDEPDSLLQNPETSRALLFDGL